MSAVVLSAAPARADDTPRIFPLLATSPLPPELAEAPSALTDALADLLDGVTTERTLEDFGKKLRCDVEMSSCLDAIARALVTSQLVYGTVASAAGGKLKVKLVRFDSAKTGSEMHQRTFTLTAQTPRRLGKQLARSAAQMFDRAPPEEVPPPAPPGEKVPVGGGDPKDGAPTPPDPTPNPDPDPVPDPDPPLTPDEEPASGGKITMSTWALIGGGGAGVAVGAGFLLSARSLQGLVERSPRETTDDFRRLTSIERAGRIRTQVGNVMLVAGGAVLAVGAVRAILQRGSGKPESMERSVALVPLEGGAAIVFSGGLR